MAGVVEAAEGRNGSIHYEITGDVTKSGDLDFFYNAGVSSFIEGGWQIAFFYDDLNNPQVVLQINSKPDLEHRQLR